MSCLCHSSHFADSLICFPVPALFQQLYNVGLHCISSTVGDLPYTMHTWPMQTWKNTKYRYRYCAILIHQYRIPNRLWKIPKNNKKKLIRTSNTDTDPRLLQRVWQKTVQITLELRNVKFLQILVNLGREIAKRLKLCEVHSFSTSSNSHHHTTTLNADVPNCYTMLKVVCKAVTGLATFSAHIVIYI